MLKHLYKTSLISVLTWSLLSFNSAIVLAQSETKATVTTDSKGVITSSKTHTFGKISDADMLSSIARLAAGVVAGRIIKNYGFSDRPLTADLVMAAAGGVAFVAGEVMSNVKFKGTIDEMTVEVVKKSDGTINEEQIQRLQDLKKSYEEAKKTTKTKKTLQLASAAAFAGAAATATYHAIVEAKLFTACMGSITTGSGALTTCPEALSSGPYMGPRYKAECEMASSMITGYKTQLGKVEEDRLSPGPSLKEKTVVEGLQDSMKATEFCASSTFPGSVTPPTACGGVKSTCTTYATTQRMNQMYSTNPLQLGMNSNDLLDQLLNKGNAQKITLEQGSFQKNFADRVWGFLSNALFPEAKASWLPMFGLTGSTLASFFLITGETAVQVDNFIFAPKNRAIAFGGLALVALNASRSSDNTIDKLDENIKKIDIILSDMHKLAKGVKTQNISAQNAAITTVNPGAVNVGSYSTNGTTKSQCMSNNSTENCASLADQLKSMPSLTNLPDSFKNIASQSVSMAEGLSGTTGISGSTLSTAEALGNKQNAIAKVLKNQQATLEKLSGGKLNFAKEQNKFLDGMRARVKKGLMKSGMTATGFMASIGASPIDSSSSKDDDKKLAKGTPLSTGNVVNTAATGDADTEKEKEALKLEFKDETPVVEGDTLYAAGGSGKPEYDMKTNEISGEYGPSLFEVISRRYIKSGYPKLLEEEPTESMNN